MSKISIGILYVITFSLPLLGQEKLPDFYTLSAKTAQRGKTNEKYKDSIGASVRETNRSQGVEAVVFFSRGPSAKYELQCFFVAQDEKTKERYVYSSEARKIEGSKNTFVFQASDLTGTVRRSASFPVVGTTTSGSTAYGTLYFNSKVTGSKIYGWLVRLVSEGKVCRVETNQPLLKSIAQENPVFFDSAF